MNTFKRTVDVDVCVVGAGVVGLAHALEARRRGLTVAVLDRDDRATGASVRNFGHLFFTSVAGGTDFERAMLARERWLELIDRAKLHAVPGGTLLLAREPDEVALLAAVAEDPARDARMLTVAEVAEIAPIPTAGVLAGFHSSLDVRVNPREAVAGLARLLADDPQARLCWRAPVHDVKPGVVHAGDLTVAAPAIVVCPGPDFRSLPPTVHPGLEPLRLCTLQMLRLGVPDGRRYASALATGLSLVRYPAFATRPEAAAIRARLSRDRPEMLDYGIHLLVTQLPDGDLIVGDSHVYGDAPVPFGEERLDNLLLDEARRLLGFEPEVKQRWQGIYPSVREETDAFLVTAPLPGVRVVQNVAGIGMTLSPGQAPAVLDSLLAETGVTAARGPAVPA